MNFDFWNGKRVFVTGHTGFKGGWTALWLHKLGAIVKGYALAPNTAVSLYDVAKISTVAESQLGDVRDLDSLRRSIFDFSPEIVIHMAAQPLVRASYIDPVGTYQTNVMGTVNLFEAVRASKSVKAVVNVTTDKCYQNNEWDWGYRENEPMGGYDPYSNSKGCSELVTSAYRQSFFNGNSEVSLASARAGNVIGGGDWSDDRLIPDALKAFDSGNPVIIRNPLATRPWQHVLEPISGYLELAEKLYLSEDNFAEGWNFGPNDEDCKTVGEVMDYLVDQWPSSVCWALDQSVQPHEAQLLKLDISKAKARLNWHPRWGLEKTLRSILNWHHSWLDDEDMKTVTLSQIKDYETQLRD
jgi:CDP-glucose 4,6-dehydratase